MHYYKFNIADYRKDTGHLSTLEHGIYRQLIDWYYLDETPIPKETQVVMRRLRLGSDELHLLQNVLTDFFNLTDNGYVHNRIEEELNEYQTQFAKNRVNGKAGGRPRKTQVVSENNPSETQVKPKHNPNHKPLTINHKPIKDISAKKIDFFAGLPEQLIFDYKSVRKAKRACAVNETVFNGLVRESKLAGITLEQALTVCVERNWIAFKAEWHLKSNPTAKSANSRDAARQTAAKSVFKPEHTQHLMGNREIEVNDAKAITA